LKEVIHGKRACRDGWRNRARGLDMLAVVLCEDQDGPYLAQQRESAKKIEGVRKFCYENNILECDWFLEVEPPAK